jgi:hypothetical protein
MNQTICLMCGDPVSLCACKTSPLTPDALEHALRARVAELEAAALRDEDKWQAADARAFEAERKLGDLQKNYDLSRASERWSEEEYMTLKADRDSLVSRLDTALIALRELNSWKLSPVVNMSVVREVISPALAAIETHPHDVWGDGRCPINCDSPEVRCALPVGHSGPHRMTNDE